jgi:hypothetical protein
MELILVVAYTCFAIAAGWYADRLGRSGIFWGIFSLVLSPLIGFVMLLALGDRNDDEEERLPCPFCAEMILPAATVCPHCRSNVADRTARDGDDAARRLPRRRL